MTADNDPTLEPTIFSAVLTPHRSLGHVGFLVLMIVFGGVSFISGMVFLLMGAWPVFGFFGLDVLLLYWAFRLNYRARRGLRGGHGDADRAQGAQGQPPRRGARMGAQSALGQARQGERTRNSASSGCFWCRAASSWRSRISSGPDEKASFAQALGNALGEAKRGVTRTTFELARNRVAGAAVRGLDSWHDHDPGQNRLSPDRFPDFAPLPTAAADYDIVRRAIAHIRGNWRSQPEIETIADAAGVTPTDLHHLFRRWCGLTPKAFLQALTLATRATCCAPRQACSTPPTRSACPAPAGCTICSSPTRRCRRANGRPAAKGSPSPTASIPRPFGTALVMATPRGLAGLALADAGKERAALARHARALAEGELCRGLRGAPRRPRAASSTRSCGAPSSRCAWC